MNRVLERLVVPKTLQLKVCLPKLARTRSLNSLPNEQVGAQVMLVKVNISCRSTSKLLTNIVVPLEPHSRRAGQRICGPSYKV